MVDGTVIPPSICPLCGYFTDRTSEINDTNTMPKPGDIWVCMGCGGLLQFGEKLEPVTMAPGVWDELSPEQQKQIKLAQFAITILRATRKKDTKQ